MIGSGHDARAGQGGAADPRLRHALRQDHRTWTTDSSSRRPTRAWRPEEVESTKWKVEGSQRRGTLMTRTILMFVRRRPAGRRRAWCTRITRSPRPTTTPSGSRSKASSRSSSGGIPIRSCGSTSPTRTARSRPGTSSGDRAASCRRPKYPVTRTSIKFGDRDHRGGRTAARPGGQRAARVQHQAAGRRLDVGRHRRLDQAQKPKAQGTSVVSTRIILVVTLVATVTVSRRSPRPARGGGRAGRPPAVGTGRGAG